jgi:glyoxylase-like metal-dependent hydrolase (beta-lactamase superfamily II)
MPTAYRRLEDGHALTINDRRWRIVVGRGHSPEHACLYCGALNVLISGDQVIPRITSNISVMGGEPEANPLKEWLYSLERFLDTLPPDALVLPAHNAPFRGLHVRLRQLIEHHEDHLLALEEACVDDEPMAMEQQVGLALGECIAHLNYLHQRGQLQRRLDGEGRYRYRSIDDTLPMRLRRQHHEVEDEVPIQV